MSQVTGLISRLRPWWTLRHHARGLKAYSNPAAPAPALDPSFIASVKSEVKKLGLNLEPATGPVEFVVIDSVARPSGN